MTDRILQQLLASLDGLSAAIAAAQRIVAGMDEPPADLLSRLQHYEQILKKQEQLSSALSRSIGSGDWHAVSREIKLISALSRMIRDDALEVLRASSAAGQAADTEEGSEEGKTQYLQ